MDPQSFRLEFTVPFPSSREAEIVYNSLRVDRDPKSETAAKQLSLDNNRLIVLLTARNAKQLRVSASSLFELLILCCRTIHRFGPAIDS